MTDHEATPETLSDKLWRLANEQNGRARLKGMRWFSDAAQEAAALERRLLEVERAAHLYVQAVEVHADGDSRRSAYQALRRLVGG